MTKANQVVIPEYGHTRPRKVRRYLRVAVKVLIGFGLAVVLAYGGWWWLAIRPYQQLRAMLERQGETAVSSEELRMAAHAVLRFPGADPHDAYLVLLRHGDASSVPVLIRSLWWQPHTPPSGNMICTKAHCLEALCALTGRNLGKNYEDWSLLLEKLPTTRPG